MHRPSGACADRVVFDAPHRAVARAPARASLLALHPAKTESANARPTFQDFMREDRSIFFFSTFLYLPLSFFSLSLSLSLSGLCAFLSARCVLSHRSEYREGALDAMNHRSRVAVVAEVRHEGRLRSWKLNNDACIANTARCNWPARQKRFSKAQYERRLVGRPEIMQM